ncbi:hypothetical protein K2173_021265 [Erythroxylum novogranatense]|uniref:Sec39 domain-containing protein n=1 Tax=Erythroxylum novogranatense TaxID=1862640 RepID=A0AAV8TWX2_9ROSI|nr:hypothetical protein K2173_021265 [Erythroxylum novogranatense]
MGMEEGESERVTEVIYETRYHASSRLCSSDYPRLPSKKVIDSCKGGFLSLFLARGVSQLKEKWRGKKDQTRIKKAASLFVSPRGERVAVATGGQITILRKEDDYQEPFGVFASSSLGTFISGVWSESHDILGVLDDTNTLYFVKENGEEMTRITNRQLKVSLPIIGLILCDNVDAKTSCLCSFMLLTNDGSLHQIELSQESNISIPPLKSSSGGLTAKRLFPNDVVCFEYDPEHSLLLVVGSTVTMPLASNGNSGYCHLSLWHKSQTLELKSLFTLQLEGMYFKPLGYVGHLTQPKVLMSPQGKFVATLDIRGCLDIFELNIECHTLSNFSGRVSVRTPETNKLSTEIDEPFGNIKDFTWWSDHILSIVKGDGTFTMINILTGMSVQENNLVYSMPVVERVRQLKGHVLLLECKMCREIQVSSKHERESSDSSKLEENIGEECDYADISGLQWSLMSISQRSIPELYNILISKHDYQAALDFANHHGLDRDEVLKSQWLHSGHGTREINMILSNIKDQGFVISECVDKVGSTEDATKALLARGLRATDRFCFSQSYDCEYGQLWKFRMARLQLLQFKDRLETYLGINMGRFSAQEYSKFRFVSLTEAAVTLAESGKIGALNLLFKRHPYSLHPFILQILAAIPETIPVQTYRQLLPGSSPPSSILLREEDWVESAEMVSYINNLSGNHEIDLQIRTEAIIKHSMGPLWPSVDELYLWYKNRAKDIDHYTGQLENCLCLIDVACQKGIELQNYKKDILYLQHLIYSDDSSDEIGFNITLVAWEQLSDYEKFKMMLKEVKEENVVKKLHDLAIPFIQSRFHESTSITQDPPSHGQLSLDECESFMVRWLKEVALENKLDICMKVIEEGCKDLQSNGYFRDDFEAVDCGLQCIYLFTVTDRWGNMNALLSKLRQMQDAKIHIESLEERLKLAEGYIEAGRILAHYQVPKPINFFLNARADEKGVKQILRLILSKFARRQQGRSDNDWANLWQDIQCIREKAFPFLDPEYMLMEFCRGLLKAGKFSLARNYLKGTSSVALASDKAENLVIQAAREYFFSASTLSCPEIWKAKECLSLFPSSRNVKTEADLIDALTIKLPNLGVTLLPLQFRQIKDPMEMVKMVITSQAGAYLPVDEIMEVAQLLGLSSSDDICTVQEAIAREAAVAGDLQLAFDLCLTLARKGHGLIWDLCAAIARGPALENMDLSSRKQLLGFALSHCDEESIGELLHAWKDLDMQGQCENLLMLTGMNSPTFTTQGLTASPFHHKQDMVDLSDYSDQFKGMSHDDNEVNFNAIKNILSSVAKSFPGEDGTDLGLPWRESTKILSFASCQLPWLLELSTKAENLKRLTPNFIPGKEYVSLQTRAMMTILSWLARNGFAPHDNVIASMARSIMEPPVTEQEDVMGCCFLLNLVDAFSGVEVIEEQLRIRENYQEICNIMNVGLIYSLLHNFGVECKGPTERRELLIRTFQEKHTLLSSDEMEKFNKVQSTFWREWKLKLEEKKRATEHSRTLEQIIHGVDASRFLSGDVNYIESSIFTLIESVKTEKNFIIKDVLKLVGTYNLNRNEVLLKYLTSILVSEVWSNDDVTAEISGVKGELINCASKTIKTISLVVYPAIDGCNKERLAYIYSLLSDCYLQLEENKEPMPVMHPGSSNLSALEVSHLCKVFEQECQRVSFIKDLNFKNIAGLDSLNLQHFRDEVYRCVDEVNLEALAQMVQTLVGIHGDLMHDDLTSRQDVYEHYILNLMMNLEKRVITEFCVASPEYFQQFTCQLEQTYSVSRMYIRLLMPADALGIMKRYFTLIIHLLGCYGTVPDNSLWQDCLIALLNFWSRLTDEMQEVASLQNLKESLVFDAVCLSVCLKIFTRLVVEDSVSPSQCWSTIVTYVMFGLTGDFAAEILNFCRAMVFSGCGFGAISEVFYKAMSQYNLISTPNTGSQDLPYIYASILDAILNDLVHGSLEPQHLYGLLSSLSKLEGQMEDLQRVRQVVWEKMAQFSDDLQIPSHVRVYGLELMQFITGTGIKGVSTELQSCVTPWEGWGEYLSASKRSDSNVSLGLPDNIGGSNKLTSTLVALKSSQLAAAIAPSIEITHADLVNVEKATLCFFKLCEASSTVHHCDTLLAILEEWEGFFVVGGNVVESTEASEAGNCWNDDDWDEGWESFQEVESFEKEKTDKSLCVHPLHLCWVEIFKKLSTLSQFDEILRLIDQSLSKSNGLFLDEEDTQTLTGIILYKNCFVALKLALLLPYEAVQLQCLTVVEEKLKEGISVAQGGDHHFLTVVLYSRIISTIITNPLYGTTFSYLCYLVGNLCRHYQENLLSRIGRNESVNTETDFLVFGRILFPCFVSELVKANQQILAGFIVTKFMHTNPSLSLINVTEATLRRFLGRQLHVLNHDEFSTEIPGSCTVLKNVICGLKVKLENLIRSALELL